MWQPRLLKIKNLMTHKDSTFEFVENKCVLIFGINNTDEDSDSNGGGKSTILEAMTLCLTNETNKNIPREDFITDGEEECSVSLYLTNNIGDVNELLIKRTFFRKKGKSVKIEIWENDILNTQITHPNEANKRILELIGISKEDLLRFFIIGQESDYSFLTANDRDKKSTISRFSNVDFINGKIETLKIKRKLENEKLDSLKFDLQKLENRLEYLDEEKIKLIEDFEKDNKERIDDLKSEIEDFEGKIKKVNKNLKTIGKDLQEIEKEIENQKIEDSSEILSKIKTVKNKIKTINSDITESEHTISHLEAIENGKVKCPNCQFEFNPNEEMSLSDISELLLQTNNILTDLELRKIKENKKLDTYEKELDKIDNQKIILRKLKSKKADLDSQLIDGNKKIKRYEKSIDSVRLMIDEIKTKNLDSALKNIEEQKSEKLQELELLKIENKKIDDVIIECDFFIKHFGEKGFMTFLTNKSIKSIEGITNSYLKKMNSTIQIILEGYTKLQSGELREKISIHISRNGEDKTNFFRYSGGEKGRVKLANVLGLQHLINLTAKNGGLNFLGLDEVFEGLDRTGQINILKTLENLKVTSLLISHRNTPIGADNEVFVEKSDGVSRILNKNI